MYIIILKKKKKNNIKKIMGFGDRKRKEKKCLIF